MERRWETTLQKNQKNELELLAEQIEGRKELQNLLKEADSSGETEVGTTQRDVVRKGVVNISVSFSVTAKWLKALVANSKQDKLSVDYFDKETAELKNTEMYIEGYKAKLEKDTSYKGLWTVSFMLKEF